MEQFALPVPTLTICELLGVPYAEREQFQRLSAARFDIVTGADVARWARSPSRSPTSRAGRAPPRSSPGTGLLGWAGRRHGSELTDRELAGVADGLLTGGIETTASMLGAGHLATACGTRDTFARLAEDESFVAPYVEELLRYLTVVQVAFPRFARRDVDLGGSRIRRDDIVLCSLSAAGRDPRIGGRPGRIEPAADRRPQLAFGHGIHRCIGAELARLELRLALPALAAAAPRPATGGPEERLEFRELSVVYGLASLPVRANT